MPCYPRSLFRAKLRRWLQPLKLVQDGEDRVTDADRRLDLGVDDRLGLDSSQSRGRVG